MNLARIRNPHAVRALSREFCDYGSESAHKLLSDNRTLYIVQSAATVTGRAAPFPSPAPAAAIPTGVVGGALRERDG